MEVKIYKLTSSEEIICRVINEESEYCTIEKARLLMINATGDLGPQIVMQPWFVGEADGKIKLAKNTIAGEVLNINNDLESSYLSHTTDIALG